MHNNATFHSLSTYINLKAALMKLVSFSSALLGYYFNISPGVRSNMSPFLRFILFFISSSTSSSLVGPISPFSLLCFFCWNYIFLSSIRQEYVLKIFSKSMNFLFIVPDPFPIHSSYWSNFIIHLLILLIAFQRN